MDLYFENAPNAEKCYSLKWWKEWLEENDFDEISLLKAKVDRTERNYFFCKHYNEVGEKGNCGLECEAYQPRNRKSGICRHYGFCYEPTEEELILKIDQ